MKPLLLMPLAALGAVAVMTFSSTVEADDNTVGEVISKCFHPFSDFVSVRFGDKSTSGHTTSVPGSLKYRPLNNKVYSMPFTLQSREVDEEREWRVIPDAESDTGPMGPDPQCKLRQWQPIKR